MIVAIDGPAGAGKSSTARSLARRLGFNFLDTGAMYRAAALAAKRAGIDLNEPNQIVNVVARIDLKMTDDRVFLDGEEVTDTIRGPAVTELIHYVADQPEARGLLVEMQRQIVADRDYVTEGRDQGSIAFPNAQCKVFLTASAEERAKRRAREQGARGQPVRWEDVLAQQTARDQRDETRAVGGLVKAADAIEVMTDGKSEQEVVDHLEQIVRRQLGPRR